MRWCAKRRASVRPVDDERSARVDPKRTEFRSAEILGATHRDIGRVAARGWLCLESAPPLARSAEFLALQMWLQLQDQRIEPGGQRRGAHPLETVSLPPNNAPDAPTPATRKTGCGLSPIAASLPARARQFRGL